MLEKAWRILLLWPLLCSAAWSLAPTQSSDSPFFLRTTNLPAGEDVKKNSTVTFTRNYTDITCASLLPPRRGSFSVEKGTGVSVGTVLVFWCSEGFQLVGSERISCILQAGTAQWSKYPPICEAIPKPEDRGLRVAVLASVVSGIIILAMSASFIICCLQERMSQNNSCDWRNISSSKPEKGQSGNRSKYWLEKEEVDWDAFSPPKIYHLPQRVEPRLPLNKPLYTSGLTGYENCGYQRSQESLLNVPLPGLYCTESLVYPHVVLHRGPTPTTPTVPSAPSAPVYLPLSTDSPPGQTAHPTSNLTTAAPNRHYCTPSHCNSFLPY
ncbi:hypothetical protein AMEX_G3242 [Astyanax mexicanus]|uniref:Uncharacterized LOC103022817 n=2 Tax=Astyanax mexicanus TaxID=7994 RepID=A0A8B9JD12_ASTMX|nr:hypothetical protein AMEX_G3242 [Astyanax mexicanus]